VNDWEEHKRAMREMGRLPMLKQCPECRGAGSTSVQFDVPPEVVRTLAKHHPNEPVENYVKRQECRHCDGTGCI
jgi:hypothetical protein